MDETKSILLVTADEWDSLSSELKEKIHLAVSSITEDVEKYKSDYNLLREEKDNKVNDLQSEVDKLSSQTVSRDSTIKDLNDENTHKDEELQKQRTEISSLTQKISELSAIQSDLSANVELTGKERDDLREIIQKKDREMDLIRSDRDRIRQDWEEYQQQKMSLKFKIEEIQTKEFSFKQKLNRMELDKKSTEERISWLEQQVKEKSEQVINIRKEMSDRLLQTEGDSEVKSIELAKLRGTVDMQKNTVEELTKKNEEYIEQVKEASEERSQMENLYRSELEAQKKLTDLYKKTASELESRDGKYEEAIEELQKIVKQASDDYSVLRETSLAEKAQLQSQVEEMTVELESMKEQVENANALLHEYKERGLTDSEVERMAPAAAAASRLLKRGKTLTQIYTEYVDMYNALEMKNEENRHLQESMQEIVTEIEEKAPILRRQREEFEQTRTINEELKVRVEESEKHMNSIQQDYEEQTRRSRYLERAYVRCKRQINDLNIQVQCMLKELERARGGVVVDDDNEMLGDMNVSSTSEDGKTVIFGETLITEGLVKVSGIRSMQEQNMKLRDVVRDLTECCEEQEKVIKDNKSTELANQLEEIRSQYEHIQLLEKRHKNSLEIVTRQRDMYKMILSHNGTDLSELSLTGDRMSVSRRDESAEDIDVSTVKDDSVVETVNVSPMRQKGDSTVQLQQLEENRATLLELQEDFKKYREDRLEHEKVQDETIQKLRTENNELRLTNARYSTKLEHSSEKFKTLDINVTNYKKEINILREMNSKYTASVAKFERDAEHMRTELKNKVERASQFEVRCEHLRCENERLKMSEIQARNELDNYLRQRNTQEMLLSNLQSIENALERRDNESRTTLTNQIGSLQRECEILKSNLEKERRSMSEHGENWTKEMNELKKVLEEEKMKCESYRKEIESSNEKIQNLEQENVTLSADSKRLNTSDIGLTIDADVTASEIEHLKKRVKELDNEKSDLSAQVARQSQQIENYKAISEGTEQQLEEQSKVLKLLEEQMSANLQAEQAKNTDLQEEIEGLNSKNAELTNEKKKSDEENQEMIEGLRRELSEAKELEIRNREEQKSSEININEAIVGKEEQIKSLRADMQTRENELREMSEKYQAELKQHSDDVRQLSNAREELDKLISEREKWQKEAEIATNEACRRERQFLQQEMNLEKQKCELNDRIEMIQKENNDYQEQIEKFGSQIISLRKAIESASKKDDDSFVNSDELKTSEDLLQVVRYLRREKELAEIDCERLQVENARVTQRMVDFDRKITQLRDELNEEKEKNKIELASAQHHADLMSKVEQLNLLTESNRLMRSERLNLENELKETHDTVSTLKHTVEPMQKELDSLRENNTTLEGTIASLQDEIERWKKRCTRLIERQEKLDPEIFKKACEDRDQLQQTLSLRDSELQKSQAEIKNMSEALSDKESAEKKLQETIANLNTRNEELNADIKSVSVRLESQVTIVAKKETSITQLREIAKKYKSEAEALKKKDNEGKFQEELKTLKEGNINLRNQLNTLQNENKTIKTNLQEVTQKQSSLSELIAKLSSVLQDVDPTDQVAVLNKVHEVMEESRKNVERLSTTNSELSGRVSTLTTELSSGAEERNELNLRTRLFESQMQKVAKENVELKKIVKHLKQNLDRQTQQSAAASAATQISQVPSSVSQQLPLQQSQAANQESTVATVTAATATVSAVGISSADEKLPPSAASPPVSAAATVVRVQPTVSNSNGSGMSSTPGGAATVVPQSRQMAEIRPMPSVACVMPTPAPQEQQQQAQGDGAHVATVSAAPLQISSVVSVTLPEAQSSSVSEPMEHQAHQPPQQTVVPTSAILSVDPPSTSGVDTTSDQPMTSTLIGPRGSKRRADESSSVPQCSFEFAATAKRIRSSAVPANSSNPTQISDTPVSIIPPSDLPSTRNSPPQQQQVSPQPRSHEELENTLSTETPVTVIETSAAVTEAEAASDPVVEASEMTEAEPVSEGNVNEQEEPQTTERVIPMTATSNEDAVDAARSSGMETGEVEATESREIGESHQSDEAEEGISVAGPDVQDEFEGDIEDEDFIAMDEDEEEEDEEEDEGQHEEEEDVSGDIEDEVEGDEDDLEEEEEGELGEDEEDDDIDEETMERDEDLESGEFEEDLDDEGDDEDDDDEEIDEEDGSPIPNLPQGRVPPRSKASMDVIELSSDESDGSEAPKQLTVVKSQPQVPSSVVVSTKPIGHTAVDSSQPQANVPETSSHSAESSTSVIRPTSTTVTSRREKIQPIVWGEDRSPRSSSQLARGGVTRAGFARRTNVGGHAYPRGSRLSHYTRGGSSTGGNFNARRGNRMNPQ